VGGLLGLILSVGPVTSIATVMPLAALWTF
jgi:hypothetical protein